MQRRGFRADRARRIATGKSIESLRWTQRGDLLSFADGLRDYLRGEQTDEADAAAVNVLEVFVMLRETLRERDDG